MAPLQSILKGAGNIKAPKSQSLFPSSKKDKRKIKHEQLLSKISKSTSSKVKRRRPNKKLVTTLDALANALPTEDSLDGGISSKPSSIRDQVNIIRHKSMKSRPGAMKRREKLDKSERNRFARNMAQMAVTSSNRQAPEASGQNTEDRWKALKGFIAQTMEKRPEVKTHKS